MTQIDPKEFGELRSDVSHLTKTTDSHTVILNSMNVKLDGLVTRVEYDENKELVNSRLDGQETRLDDIELRHKIEDQSVWKKIGGAVEGNFIKFMAGGLFIIALAMGYMLIQQQIKQSAPEQIQTITNVKE